jgi:hypothetical protein
MFRFVIRQVVGRPVSSVVVAGIATEATTEWPSKRLQHSRVYHTVADEVATPLLRSRWVDPEGMA